MAGTPNERELIKADVLETLSSVRCIKNRTGGVPMTADELFERRVTKDEELLLDVLDEMVRNDTVPLEYALKRQRTVCQQIKRRHWQLQKKSTQIHTSTDWPNRSTQLTARPRLHRRPLGPRPIRVRTRR